MSTTVPKYLLYGQPSDGPVDWFLNIEKLATRCKERGWAIEPHSHPAFSQVMFVLQGSGSMLVEQGTLEFSSPCALIIPMNAVHGFEYAFNTDGWVVTLAEYCLNQMVSRVPQIQQLWEAPAVVPLDINASQIDMINHRIFNIQRELQGREDSYEMLVEADLMSILIEVRRASRSSRDTRIPSSDRQLKLVSTFRSLVEKQFTHNLKISEYARILNVSAFQLRSACEAVSNKSPKEILEERILTEAKRDLIFSSRNIEQIGYHLGFSDPSYFTRFFKKMEGQSPSSFRRSFQAQAK